VATGTDLIEDFAVTNNFVEFDADLVDLDGDSTPDTFDAVGISVDGVGINVTGNTVVMRASTSASSTYDDACFAMSGTDLLLTNNSCTCDSADNACTMLRSTGVTRGNIIGNTVRSLSNSNRTTGVALYGTSSGLQIAGNYSYFPGTLGRGVRQNAGALTDSIIARNFQIAGEQQVDLSADPDVDQVVVENNICHDCGSWQVATAATTNIYERGNKCIGCWAGGTVPGADADSVARAGHRPMLDTDADGTIDSTVDEYYFDASSINLDDDSDAIHFRTTSGAFVGTCGSSECLVYDLDDDGTIEATDSCIVDGGQDADCDGTAEGMLDRQQWSRTNVSDNQFLFFAQGPDNEVYQTFPDGAELVRLDCWLEDGALSSGTIDVNFKENDTTTKMTVQFTTGNSAAYNRITGTCASGCTVANDTKYNFRVDLSSGSGLPSGTLDFFCDVFLRLPVM